MKASKDTLAIMAAIMYVDARSAHIRLISNGLKPESTPEKISIAWAKSILEEVNKEDEE